MTRRIAVVTGSRAEYGLLYWLMRAIDADPALALQLVVTGMHLAPEFGLTVEEIRRDGFAIADCVETQLSSDSRAGMAKSLGLGIVSMTDALRRLAPHIVVVLGDRYEILAAAQAAALLGIPVAHISGGEVTEGAVDDWIRHSVTKAAWWHFVAAEPYRRRVIQLGEDPARVFNVGDTGLDAINRLEALSRPVLSAELGLDLAPPLFLATYHPATLGELPPATAFAEMLSALDRFPQATVVLTKPNADAGGRELAAMADDWAERNTGRARCVASLGQRRYLSLMRQADLVVGNSSSGIVEAPPMKVATVNVGTRQKGRLYARSILHCGETTDDIAAAIEEALSPVFRAQVQDTESLYGDCNATDAIHRILATADLPIVLAKTFHDA
jgi:UDP-N-acetylglucosamine 2-epimerase (non-hydrolysing)/GDP/UDP-N,N'-diacetylbacillosamine 2-epimerase (hydrolysing)